MEKNRILNRFLSLDDSDEYRFCDEEFEDLSCTPIYYHSVINRFLDEYGEVLTDISNYIHVWILDKFRRDHEYTIIFGKDGRTLYEIILLERVKESV